MPSIRSASPTQAVAGATVALTLTGTGFVPSTVILENGVAVPTTYQSSTSVIAQVSAPAGSTANVSVQAQNPAPGGGTSPVVTLGVAILELNASDSDGTNTGTARLLGAVNLATINTDAAHQAVSWSLQGAGTLTPTGTNNFGATYTSPSTMPANPTVIVTAYLSYYPVVTTSYTFTLTNPIPNVYFSTPQAVEGATVPLTFSGYNLVPNTVILLNGVPAATTFVSSTSLTALITAPPGSSGNLTVEAETPAPGGGTSPVLQVPIASLSETATDPDGTNTGTARLGVPVNITANNRDTLHVGVGWTVQGGGTLSTSGTTNANAIYTPPPTMPSSSAVTITAYLTALPALTTSYTLNLINPVPTVTSTSPVHLRAGGTQTVTLTGSGFVPRTTVTMNGTTYATTYVSYNSATVAITMPGDATGKDTLQVVNPAPGGGAGTTFTMKLLPESVSIVATNADGSANNGTVALGSTLSAKGFETGSVNTAIAWRVVGAGSISTVGLYTPPAVMPANPAVSIVGALASNPAITATYALNLINPVPEITSLSPDKIPAGLTTKVTVTGTGFVPSTEILVNGIAVPVTYQSSTSLVAEVAVGVSGTGNFHLQASTTSDTGGVSEIVNLAISAPVSATAAARILDQTTFGPTPSLIQQVEQEGLTPWLTQQFNTPQTVLPIVSQPPPLYCGGTEGTAIWCVDSEWWQTAVTGNDQLRQRVAFTLSELFVSSADVVEGWEMDAYMNMLAADAFTNWYTIMNDVTLSPAMGIYLNMVNSGAPTGTLIANENYARENMQLFNLGLDLLNQDGSLQLDGNGNPIPAYTEAQVQAFARAYTGWTFANPDGSAPNAFTWTANYYDPLAPVESEHDENPKTLLNGTTLPAGQTAEQDLAGALTNIFEHPNVPPFVCTQLIQHLVRSDPYPVYISRCAKVFMDDGNGVRGDMQAVLTEILTDPEARDGDTGPQPSDGHLREPILWMTAVMRGLGYVNVDPNNDWQSLDDYMDTLNERPLWQPSVFNFYPPSYVIPGTTLNAPEFGLENTASVMDRLTLADNLTSNNIAGFNVDLSATSPLGQLASSPTALVNQLGMIFMDNKMDPNLSTAIINAITPLTNPADRVQMATDLVITSSEYKVLH